jgi:hypothetical protein
MAGRREGSGDRSDEERRRRRRARARRRLENRERGGNEEITPHPTALRRK